MALNLEKHCPYLYSIMVCAQQPVDDSECSGWYRISTEKQRRSKSVSVTTSETLNCGTRFYVPRVQTLTVLKSNEIDKTEQFVNVIYE